METGFKQQPICSLLSPVELARILNISKATVYRLIEKRSLPFFKVGGSIRFDTKDINAYLGKNRIKPVDEII